MTDQKSTSKKHFWLDALKYLPSIFISAVVGIVLLPILTRLFTPASYGNYALAATTFAFLQVIANTWLNSTIIRFYPIAAIDGETGKLNSTAYVVTLVGTATGALIFVVALFLLHGKINDELFLLLLFIPLQLLAFNLTTLPLQVTRAERHLGAFNILNAVRVIVPPFLSIIVCFFFERSVVVMFAVTTILFWILLPFGYKFCFTEVSRPRIKDYDKEWSKRLLNYGLPLIPALLLVKVLEVSDRYLIALFRGNLEAGIYTANYTIASLPMELVMLLITAAASPLISSLWENKGKKETESFLSFIFLLYILLGLPAMTGLSLMSKELVVLMSTPDYLPGAIIIPYVSAGGFFVGMQWIAQRGMILAEKTQRILFLYVFAGFLNIILNFIFIPKYGFIAAALTTLGCYILLFILIYIGSSKYVTLAIPYKSLFRSISACILMAIVVMNIRIDSSPIISILVKVTSGVTVYALALYLFGELKQLKSIKAMIAPK